MTDTTKTLWWNDEHNLIMMIDQTKLPVEFFVIEVTTVERLADAIRRLEVRGAPALGVAGAFGVALSALSCTSDVEFAETVAADAALLKSTRPTAVNLAWGIDKVLRSMENLPPDMARFLAVTAAKNIAPEDESCCMLLGRNGVVLLPQIGTVLTHCNAGALACSTWGTAFGVIRSAHKMGKKISVISCETRPLLQGARLTAWELHHDNIPVISIIDSEARISCGREGSTASLSGLIVSPKTPSSTRSVPTMHAVCAKHHNIPFYVAAPSSIFDPDAVEAEIIVEERGRDEVATFSGRPTVPDGVAVINYAFDATPLDLVTAIITEKGVLYPPYDFSCLRQM